MALVPTPARIDRLLSLLNTGPAGEVQHYSQAVHEERPFTNCRIYGFLAIAHFAGLRFGGVRNAGFVTDVIRGATGIAEVAADGRSKGTSHTDLERALDRIMPWVNIRHQWMVREDMLKALSDRRFIVGVAVHLPKLPVRQTRFTGRADIGHFVLFTNARKRNGKWQVKYQDPMGPQNGYKGDWVDYAKVRPALMQVFRDSVFVTYIEKGEAVLANIVPTNAFPFGATATVQPGTYKTYRVDTETGDFLLAKNLTVKKASTWNIRWRVNVSRRPDVAPKGNFVFLLDGPAAGRYVRVSDVTIKANQGGDVEASYARGFADGKVAAAADYKVFTPPAPLFLKEAA